MVPGEGTFTWKWGVVPVEGFIYMEVRGGHW